MSDTLTVQFGGREVVLKVGADGPRISMWSLEKLVIGTLCGKWFAAYEGLKGDCYGDSPQAAATALEHKLRQIRDKLNEVLGQEQGRDSLPKAS